MFLNDITYNLRFLVSIIVIIYRIPGVFSNLGIGGGNAEINIKSFEQCPEPEQYQYKLEVIRHKINRTHEAFDGKTDLGIPLDERTGVYVHMAKKTLDGSYRPNVWIFEEKNACDFFLTWIGESFKEVLDKLGLPPQCPIPPGKYELQNYLIDFRALPSALPYGDFRADIYLIREGEKVLCIQCFAETKSKLASKLNG